MSVNIKVNEQVEILTAAMSIACSATTRATGREPKPSIVEEQPTWPFIEKNREIATKEETEPFSFFEGQPHNLSSGHICICLDLLFAFCFGLQINYYLNHGRAAFIKELFSRWPFTILICGGFFDKRYNSPIYRHWLHSLGTRSEGIFGVKRYNSPIYRDLLHSLGTRSEDNFLKVFNTT